MKKPYILLTMLLCSFFIRTFEEEEMNAKAVKRSSGLVSSALYYPITSTNLDHGKTITRPGAYVLSSSTTVSATSAQEQATINTAATNTDGVIRVSVSNVTINLNGYHLRPAKDSLVAIYVDDNLTDVIIENGTISGAGENWEAAIVVGQGCSDITIRNMRVQDCDDGAVYSAIDLKGVSAAPITGATLENVVVTGYQGANTAASAIKATYVDSLTLRNVRANNASVAALDHTAISLANCNEVVLDDVQTNNNVTTGAGGSIVGLSLDTCKDVSLANVSANGNAPIGTGDTFDGILMDDCLNVTGYNLKANNNSTAAGQLRGIRVINSGATSKYIKLDAVTAANNTAAGDVIYGLWIANTNNFTGSNIDVSDNTTDTGSAIGLTFSTCNNTVLSNVFTSSLAAGTATTGIGLEINVCTNFEANNIDINNISNAKSGINFGNTASSNVALSNFSITNCASGAAGFVGVNAEVAITALSLRNATISNNTGTTTLTGVLVGTATSSNVLCNNIDIISNTATAGQFAGFNFANVNRVSIDNARVEHNVADGTGTTAYNLYGLLSNNTVTNISITNSNFSYNSATFVPTAQDDGGGITCAGVLISNSDGTYIDNCKANNNTGSALMTGFSITGTDNAVVTNCIANSNQATIFNGANTSSNGCRQISSGGFKIQDCSWCRFENCTANNNLAGNYSTGGGNDIVNATSGCYGFGFLNLGTALTDSIGNSFVNCTANGNGTQHDTAIDAAVEANYATTGLADPNDYRYEMSEAIAAGFLVQLSQAVNLIGCSANSNGLQNNLVSFGFLTVNGCRKTNITGCSASNNWYYGFVDGGAMLGAQVNCESVLTKNYSALNGTHNTVASSILYDPPGAAAVGDADGDQRNYWMYFSDPGQITPMVALSYGGQTAVQGIGNEFANISMTFQAQP